MADNKYKKERFPLRLRWGAIAYFILYCYAILMTQLLRNPISNVFFWFMTTAAPLSFIIMLIGKATVQVYVMTDRQSTEKLSPVEYEIRVINTTPLPFPFVEAVMSKPREDGVRCLKEKLVLSLVPFGGYSVKQTVIFPYRGLYEIGVHELYIYDPLRLFRMRVDINNFSNVTVYPRRLEFEADRESAVSDLPSPIVRQLDTRDKSEVSNIREYRMGDSLKSVHWKLSSKSEELQVKDYNTNDDRHTYIFVDLAAPTPAPEIRKSRARLHLKALSKESANLSLKERLSVLAGELKENKKAHKYRRRRARGNTAKDIETMDMIDVLIRETSGSAKLKKKNRQENIDALFVKEDNRTAAEVLEKLAGDVENEIYVSTAEQLRQASLAWGGSFKPEIEDEMGEYCADGVVEIAVSAMARELRRQNKCTVVWYDSRSESGMYAFSLSDMAELDDIYARFACAAVVPEDRHITDLTGIIGEAVNVTVRIVTANIDPESVARYCTVPAMFGGAGTGCVTEVMLFNPHHKYSEPTERLEYTEGVRLQLRHNGIVLSDIKEISQSDGRSVLMCDGLI